jgi:hypothetical protein
MNATDQAKRIIGIRLAEKQWQVEAANIFEASLAGMQIRVLDYARGTYGSHPNVIDRTPPVLQNPSTNVRAAVEISMMCKFRDDTYKNVSAVGFWGINALCIVLFLASRRYSSAQRRTELEDMGFDGGYHDYLWGAIAWTVCVWEPAKAAVREVAGLVNRALQPNNREASTLPLSPTPNGDLGTDDV